MQALPAQPESLCIVEMGGTEKQDELGERGSIGFLYLNIGLQVSGELAGHKCKFPPAFPDPRLGRDSTFPQTLRGTSCTLPLPQGGQALQISG